MILAYSLQAGIPVLASSVFGIGCSVLVGLVNGILITTLNIPPFIITLGMANIVKGIILVMSEGYICSLSEPLIINIGQGTVGPVPIMVIILIFLIVIFAFILSQTVFGNRVKAVGGNELAAELSGIKNKNSNLCISSLWITCGIAGIIITGRLNGGNPNAAKPMIWIRLQL